MQVAISFAKILLQVTRPKTAVLGKLPGTTVYRNILQYPKAAQIPGMLIVRVDSAIYFSNSNYIKDRYVFSKFVHTTPRSIMLRKCRIVSSFWN
jgi:MFS superfamily sulfate permease-like transporter